MDTVLYKCANKLSDEFKIYQNKIETIDMFYCFCNIHHTISSDISCKTAKFQFGGLFKQYYCRGGLMPAHNVSMLKGLITSKSVTDTIDYTVQ